MSPQLFPYVLFATLLVCSFIAFVSDVHAMPPSFKGTAIGIVIEKSCQISPNCLKYKDILFLDNSNPTYTGTFVNDTKMNDVKRSATSNQNNYKWLLFTPETTILVDPPLKFRGQIPIITIVSQLDEYHSVNQMNVKEYKTEKYLKDQKATQNIRITNLNWYVDKSCTNGVITAKNWKTLIADMTSYLFHDCDPKYMSVSNTYHHYTNITKHDLPTSNKYKLDKFYQDTVKNCLKSRNACTTVDNRATNTMGDER